MPKRKQLGGIVHTYQRYDPRSLPLPSEPAADVVSPAMEHLLTFGSLRELTEEELAQAVRIDPSQIAGLGPSLAALRQLLEERKAKILATYETDTVCRKARQVFHKAARKLQPPAPLRKQFERAIHDEQLRDLERLWYRTDDERGPFARGLVQLVARLGDQYEVEELAAKYFFTGHQRLDVPQALEVKHELERIDELLEQLAEAAKTAQIGVVDLDALREFAEPGDVDELSALQQQVQDYLRELAERQGLEQQAGSYQLTPRAYRLFQQRLLVRIFAQLSASRTGRHAGPVTGDGAVEQQQTKQYEFGDSVAHLDIAATVTNALLRSPSQRPLRIVPDDMQIHRTRNTPKCATCVVMDMSGSMRYGGQYVHVKRMGLALNGLIRSEFPGDYLQFVEMYSVAKARAANELVHLMPKPVTIHDPVVRLRADMSRLDVSESQIPPHFTNIQHGLQLARQLLAGQDTPNRQIILITDGLPTAHFEGELLYLLYPPDPLTEEATMREGRLCQREGIVINLFLVPSWSQSEEDIRFAHRLAASTQGRVFFTGGGDLDRYVVWDYLERRREIIG